MTEGELKHDLAGILSADGFGCSRLMAVDEIATIGTGADHLHAAKRGIKLMQPVNGGVQCIC